MTLHSEDGTTLDLIQYRLTISDEDLSTAKDLFEQSKYRIANNRAYYAIFHAISAIHALDGNSYKRHKDAIGNFNKNYIKTEIFPKEFGKTISKAEYIREASDYDCHFIASKSVTSDLISTAEELLSLIKKYINEKLANVTLN